MPDNHYPSSWITDRDFVLPTFNQDIGGICVRVSVLNTSTPRYSYTFGWKMPEGDLRIHIQPSQAMNPADVSVLFADAQAYLNVELKRIKAIEDKREADRQAALAVERQNDQARKKRYEDNKKQRAEDNRQRSRGGSGKKGGK